MAPSLRRSPARRRLAADPAAVGSSVVAFMVAGVLFMGSVVALLVATNNTGSKGTTDESTAATMRIQARDLAGTVLTSPGFGAQGDWADAANAYTGRTMNAEGLQRLGLLDDQAVEPNMLEFAKFQNLRRAKYAADPADGYVDYQEAVHSLGLDTAGLDFHVRAYPFLKSLHEMVSSAPPTKDGNLRVTYIGHYNVTYASYHVNPPSPTYNLTVTKPTCAVSTSVADSPQQGNPAGQPQNYRLETTVVNGGNSTTQFSGLFTYKLIGPSVTYQGSRTTQSFLVPPHASTTLYVDVPARSGMACGAQSTISVTVQDPTTNTLSNSTTLATAVTGATVSARDISLDTTKTSYRNVCSDPVELVWNSPANDIQSNDKMVIKLYRKDNGTLMWSSGEFNGNRGHKATLPNTACLAAGEYRAYLYYYTGSSWSVNSEHVVQRVLVTSGTVAGYVAPGLSATDFDNPIYNAQPPVAVEVGYLNTMLDRFCPTYYDSKTVSAIPAAQWPGDWDSRCSAFASGRGITPNGQPGDVIPDAKRDMDSALPARLLNADGTPRYDIANVLVVGSKVSQTSMTSGAAKFAVRDWVLGGGTLLVFGSDAQNVNWLEPLFHAAIRSGSDAISVPDISHPILHTPDELDDPAHTYDARGQTWNFNGQTAQAQGSEDTALFTNVIVEGDALTGNPLLADSKPGAIGNGSIILTTYLPYDLYNNPAKSGQPSTGLGACPGYTVGQCESMKFVHNLLMSGYGDLYLDYGPQCPLQTNCIPEVRSAQIRHPDFTDPIQLRLNVFVFPH